MSDELAVLADPPIGPENLRCGPQRRVVINIVQAGKQNGFWWQHIVSEANGVCGRVRYSHCCCNGIYIINYR